MLRTWATPLVGGFFLVMAATGLLMFFDLNTPLGHELHEWLGWAFVLGAAAHIAVNFGPLKNHLSRTPGRVMVLVGVVVIAAAVVPLEKEAGPSPVRSVMMTMEKAPLKDLAVVAHRDVAELITALDQAGFPGATADSTAASLGGEERERRGQVLAVIFPAPSRK